MEARLKVTPSAYNGRAASGEHSKANAYISFEISLCVYMYIDVAMTAPCTSWCCSCASSDSHTLPKRVLPIRGPDSLTGPCTDTSCTAKGDPAFVVKMEGSQCESADDTDAEQLATEQLYRQTAEWGGRALYPLYLLSCMYSTHIFSSYS